MNSETFRIKYLSLADTLYKVAFYILESECDAKDAVQDLYLKLWRDRDRLDAVINPKAYCITLLKNRCIDHLRQTSRTDHPTEMPVQDDGGRDEKRLHDKERLERVMKDIGRLPQKQREVLIMRTIDGLDYKEISERTGTSVIMLRVLLSKARQTLRQNETHTKSLKA
ncbi:MAG: RNA polymerase sigma factor [Candidatus Cryptobacteroides sp.]